MDPEGGGPAPIDKDKGRVPPPLSKGTERTTPTSAPEGRRTPPVVSESSSNGTPKAESLPQPSPKSADREAKRTPVPPAAQPESSPKQPEAQKIKLSPMAAVIKEQYGLTNEEAANIMKYPALRNDAQAAEDYASITAQNRIQEKRLEAKRSGAALPPEPYTNVVVEKRGFLSRLFGRKDVAPKLFDPDKNKARIREIEKNGNSEFDKSKIAVKPREATLEDVSARIKRENPWLEPGQIEMKAMNEMANRYNNPKTYEDQNQKKMSAVRAFGTAAPDTAGSSFRPMGARAQSETATPASDSAVSTEIVDTIGSTSTTPEPVDLAAEQPAASPNTVEIENEVQSVQTAEPENSSQKPITTEQVVDSPTILNSEQKVDKWEQGIFERQQAEDAWWAQEQDDSPEAIKQRFKRESNDLDAMATWRERQHAQVFPDRYIGTFTNKKKERFEVAVEFADRTAAASREELRIRNANGESIIAKVNRSVFVNPEGDYTKGVRYIDIGDNNWFGANVRIEDDREIIDNYVPINFEQATTVMKLVAPFTKEVGNRLNRDNQRVNKLVNVPSRSTTNATRAAA